MPRRVITVITAMVVALLGAGVSVGLAPPALAGSCSRHTGAAKSDPNTGWKWTTWWVCGNAAGAKLYRAANTGTVTGYMDSTRSWFVCWRRGAQHSGGNNVWYYTQGDRAASGQSARHAWGFMPAVKVHTSTDPWPGMAQCPTSTPKRSNGYKTLILLHGYEMGGEVNCTNYWGKGEVERYLKARGWSGKLVKATFYSAGGGGCTARIPGAGTVNRGIDELGADFAWFVYRNYSSRGKVVDVVAHSMGGLVTRVAIAGTANRGKTASGRAFPPYLYIEDAVTLSSPHQGGTARATAGCIALSSKQCKQMKPKSDFLNTWILRPAGKRVGYDNPQSTMGTDWSAVGSGDDWMVSTGSALNIGATYHFGHKYIYLSGSGLDHGKMSDITGGSYAMRYCDYSESCDMRTWKGWAQMNDAAGPLWVAANAVYFSASW